MVGRPIVRHVSTPRQVNTCASSGRELKMSPKKKCGRPCLGEVREFGELDDEDRDGVDFAGRKGGN